MKRIIRQKLARSKRCIERRLDKTNVAGCSQPMMTASNIHYEIAERSLAVGVGGLGARNTVQGHGHTHNHLGHLRLLLDPGACCARSPVGRSDPRVLYIGAAIISCQAQRAAREASGAALSAARSLPRLDCPAPGKVDTVTHRYPITPPAAS